VILRIPGFGQGTAEAIAFDRDGRLWVSSYEGDVVVAILPKDLHTGSPSPGVRLRLPTLSGPIGLTVRRDRLWIAEASANAVVAYGLSREGPSRGPVATIRDPSQTMPHSITFDDRGDAWVPYYNGIVGRFRSDRLGARHVTEGDLVLR
jgi:sugar lactone lactonase YvrE